MDTTIEMVESNEDFDRMVDDLQKTVYAGLDIETTTDPWYTPEFRILTISVSTREGHAYVIPCEHPQANRNGFIEFHNSLKRLPQQPTWIMQNGSFDYVALMEYGIKLDTPWFDTMVAQYLIDVEASKSLTALAARWLGIMPWKDIDYKHPEEEDLTILARLNGRDADFTRRLYVPLDKALHDGGFDGLYDDLMMPAVLTLCDMEMRGVPVNRDRLLDVIDKTEDDLAHCLDYIRRVRGVETFNPNSTKQMSHFLYVELGLPITVWTEKGNPSTNAEALQNIEKQHSVIPVIQEFRTKRKLLTASLLPWLEKLDRDDRLHPRYKPAHVKTGRLSSEMPNIQQVPRGDIRKVFGSEDNVIIEADYSQLELRIVAWLTGEPTMTKAFRDGEDLHQLTADAFGVDRQTAKALNFGLLYGAGPRKLRQVAAADYGVEMTEIKAEALRLQWFQKYSAIEEFHKSAVAEARLDGGTWSAFGRWRPLPELFDESFAVKAHAERQAINTPVQSPASDITLLKLTQLAANPFLTGLDCHPIATVHDSILFEVPHKYAQAAADYIKFLMEDTGIFKSLFGVEIDVPLAVDIKTGQYWGETE